MSEVADLLGRTVAGKFTIEAHIGGGAMGEVYRARHVVLDTAVALKVLRADIAKDPTFRERFYREAKAASSLEHPCSVRVTDFGQEPDGLTYLAMELLSGRDLLVLLREEWPITEERIVDILAQTLGAVAAAHAIGILHRDIKPENIMVKTTTDDDGHVRDVVKVCDFGIAKVSDSRAFSTENDGKSLTSSGALVGTPEYMSPEQARGDALDPRSDVYSVGIVLYQMLTGKLPFTGDNVLSVALKQVTDAPVPPSKLRPEVNPKLEAICLRALEKDRNKRFAGAREMRAELRAAVASPSAVPSLADSSTALPAIAASQPDLNSAPTIRDERVDFGPKETSVGAEVAVRPPSSRRTIVGVAVGALAVGAVLAFAFARPGSNRPNVMGEVAPTPSAPASFTPIVPDSTPSVRLLPLTPPASASVVPVALPPSSSARRATPSAAPPGPSAPIASAAPVASTEPAPEVAYNPSGASLALDRLTTERVRPDAVRSKIAEAMPDLTTCYRDALRTAGAPVGGLVEVAMSIDEQGKVVGIVNAPKLSALQRCVQVRVNRIVVAPSAIDGPGASASQWLKLNP